MSFPASSLTGAEKRFNLAAGGEARYAQGNFVGSQFFDTLRAPCHPRPHLHRGRRSAGAALERRFSATASGKKNTAGVPTYLGKSISLDNHPVPDSWGGRFTGIQRNGMDVGSTQDLYVPICAEKIIHTATTSMLDHRSAWWIRVIGRPKPGISRKPGRRTAQDVSALHLRSYRSTENWKPDYAGATTLSAPSTPSPPPPAFRIFRKDYRTRAARFDGHYRARCC